MGGQVIRDHTDPRVRSWTARLEALDWLFIAVVAVTVGVLASKVHDYTYIGDDWRLALRGHSLGDYIKPYNQHLSVVPIAGYRLLYAVFGFRTFAPLYLVGILTAAGIAVAAYLTVRSRAGAALAFVAGVALLWFPGNLLLAAAFNHYLAMIAVYFCAWELDRNRPASDLPLALALGFALISSGVSVAGAAGCLTYLVLTRPPLRRWLAVGLPTAAWVIWYELTPGTQQVFFPRSVASQAQFVGQGILNSFRGLAGGNQVLGVLLLLAFVANLCWRTRRGPRRAAHELAWSAGLVTWWVGLARARGRLDQPDNFRYELIGGAFIVLAFLPARPFDPEPIWMRDRVTKGAAVLVALLLVAASYPGIADLSRTFGRGTRNLQQVQITANLGPRAVPDATLIHTGLDASLAARVYRSLVAAYGAPAGTRPADPDAAVVALGGFELTPVPALAPSKCPRLPDPVRTQGGMTVRIQAQASPVTVRIRRFQSTWVTLGTIAPGHGATMVPPGLNSPVPWQISAPGACGKVPPS
jgi:hypothetical protein